jgi:hypothetical protein
MSQPVKEKPIVDKTVWSYLGIVILSFVFGYVSSYLLIWQNILRIDPQAKVRGYLIWGAVICEVVSFVLAYFTAVIPTTYGDLAAAIFLYWFYIKYYKKWASESGKKEGYTKEALIISFVGAFLMLGLVLLNKTLIQFLHLRG